MIHSELQERDPRRNPAHKSPAHLGAAALAAAALLLPALPAGAAAPRDGEREVRKERVVVLSRGGGEGGLLRGFHLLGGGYLGVELMPLTPELRAHFGVPEERGVMIARVLEDSPAARAGLRVGDVVTSIEAEAVESPWDLSVAVRGKEAGEEVALEVWRDGRPLDFAVSVEERDRERIDLAPLLRERLGENAELLRFSERFGEEGAPTLYFEPEVVERLGESLDKIDWPRLNRRLGERNQELERRLAELEKRLQELERALNDR